MLTPKQEKFVQELIRNGGNQRKAYMAAYDCERMKAETIDNKAYALLKNGAGGEVRARYDELREKLAAEADSQAVADALEVLKYFTRVMRREETENIVVTLKDEKTEWKKGPDGKPKKVTTKREIPEVVKIPAKLSDANTAAGQLAKHLGLLDGKKDDGSAGVLDEILKAVKDIG